VLGATGLTRSTIQHAAQTISYDQSGTRLFVAGGPLLVSNNACLDTHRILIVNYLTDRIGW